MSAPRSAAQKRPTPARKVTAKTEANRRDALEQGIRLTLDEGKTWHVLRVGDVTPEVAREIRSKTGHGFLQLISMLTEYPDLDLVQEAVWAARRLAGEDIDLSEIAIDYDLLTSDGFDIDVATPPTEAVGDDPEASGGVS